MNTPLSQDINFTFSHYSLQNLLNTAWMQGTALMLLCASILFINIDGWICASWSTALCTGCKRDVTTGDYLVPHLGAKVYPNKPPLFFWLIAICSMPYGDVTPAAARLHQHLQLLRSAINLFLRRKLYNSLTGLLQGLFFSLESSFLACHQSADWHDPHPLDDSRIAPFLLWLYR